MAAAPVPATMAYPSASLLLDHAAKGRAGMASVAIFDFLGLWNQFLRPMALNTDPDHYVLTHGVASFASQAGYSVDSVDVGSLFAAVVMPGVPVLLVYLLFQRRSSSADRPAQTRRIARRRDVPLSPAAPWPRSRASG